MGDEQTQEVETVEAIRMLWQIATPAPDIAKALHLPQATVIHVLQKGTLPPREPQWIQTDLFGGGAEGGAE